MRTYFHGNDRGGVTLAALVFILVLSLIFLSLAPVIAARGRLARAYRADVLERIRAVNSELVNLYDLY
jgi:hypothetical protein